MPVPPALLPPVPVLPVRVPPVPRLPVPPVPVSVARALLVLGGTDNSNPTRPDLDVPKS